MLRVVDAASLETSAEARDERGARWDAHLGYRVWRGMSAARGWTRISGIARGRMNGARFKTSAGARGAG